MMEQKSHSRNDHTCFPSLVGWCALFFSTWSLQRAVPQAINEVVPQDSEACWYVFHHGTRMQSLSPKHNNQPLRCWQRSLNKRQTKQKTEFAWMKLQTLEMLSLEATATGQDATERNRPAWHQQVSRSLGPSYSNLSWAQHGTTFQTMNSFYSCIVGCIAWLFSSKIWKPQKSVDSYSFRRTVSLDPRKVRPPSLCEAMAVTNSLQVVVHGGACEKTVEIWNFFWGNSSSGSTTTRETLDKWDSSLRSCKWAINICKHPWTNKHKYK